MKKLVLITVHGMGVTKQDYSLDLQRGLASRLGQRWEAVSVQPVWYAPVFQKNEDALWSALAAEPRNDLDSTALRKLFLFGFADAAAFERSAHVEHETYLRIQGLIRSALTVGFEACGRNPDTPVVVVAQSLGGQVFSSYAWDAEKGQHLFAEPITEDAAWEAFIRLKSLRQIVTTGCNIPIFTAGLTRRVNFNKPNKLTTWNNYYDPDDVLGWPLRQLDAEGTYHWVQDHPIAAGNILTGWNPASHTGYWDDKDVLNPIADGILTLLK